MEEMAKVEVPSGKAAICSVAVPCFGGGGTRARCSDCTQVFDVGAVAPESISSCGTPQHPTIYIYHD